jgi:hypothetical protein
MASNHFVTDPVPASAFEKLTVSTTVVPPTPAKVQTTTTAGLKANACKAFVTVETNSIRVRYDGSDPDANTGHLLTAGSSITLIGEQNVAHLRMIRASADATVQITYYFTPSRI